jgi:hypothetical protein
MRDGYLILGMHRSGTSALAGVERVEGKLNMIGSKPDCSLSSNWKPGAISMSPISWTTGSLRLTWSDALP